MEAFEICAGCRGLAISRDYILVRISLGGGVHLKVTASSSVSTPTFPPTFTTIWINYER
jgi:hypothetical protein